MTTSELTAAIDVNIQLLDGILYQMASDASEAASASEEGRTNEAIGWLSTIKTSLVEAEALLGATIVINKARRASL
ncbi:hypothetical protein [Rhodospirillum sp. A1_3_36]|uniref:hypothetical protein n=1 Tax=Rhodospirillum sp. A1_3_36 TaxID=3391666 RepID=UPI0039A52DDE